MKRSSLNQVLEYFYDSNVEEITVYSHQSLYARPIAFEGSNEDGEAHRIEVETENTSDGRRDTITVRVTREKKL